MTTTLTTTMTLIGRTAKIMKCKAWWISRVKLWMVWCGECRTQMSYTDVNGDSRLPHDIAASHAKRYHRG